MLMTMNIVSDTSIIEIIDTLWLTLLGFIAAHGRNRRPHSSQAIKTKIISAALRCISVMLRFKGTLTRRLYSRLNWDELS